MYYGAIKKTDIANGDGVRVSLFVSGCRRHCPDCFNRETWDFGHGKPFGYAEVQQILVDLNQPYIQGLSILGGEPLEPENLPHVSALITSVRKRFGLSKDVWVYTGCQYEDVKNLNLMHDIDVLVDGAFIREQRDITLHFRGSRNQRIIDIQASLASGDVVLWRQPS